MINIQITIEAPDTFDVDHLKAQLGQKIEEILKERWEYAVQIKRKKTCPNCGASKGYTYFRKDGTMVCRACGTKTEPAKK